MAQETSLNPVLRKKILNYLSLLKKEGIEIEKAILFGSYAKGKAKPYSDIDVCLLSKQFGKNIFKEEVKVAQIAHRIDILFEPHVFHPNDLKEKYNPLAVEIKKHGVVIS